MALVGDWARPISPTKVNSFVGLARYYIWSAEGFSSIIAPLTRLT